MKIDAYLELADPLSYAHTPTHSLMAAELQPLLEPTISATPTTTTATSSPSPHITTVTATTPAIITDGSAATTTTTTTALLHSSDNPGQFQLGQKRQRRPSVRLGEIGDQPAATVSIDSHVRRGARYPWTKLPRDSTAKSVKARSITNLVNNDSAENGGDGNNNNNNFEFGGGRKIKSKRAATAKRVRSSWARIDDGGGGESGEGWMSGGDADRESPAREESLPQSAEENWEEQRGGVRNWGGGSESRENDAVEMPVSNWSGVRTWLIELGLSRYTPVFEIHEVDDEVLPMLTLEDLKDMGINAVGSRRKMYSAIQKLRKGFS